MALLGVLLAAGADPDVRHSAGRTPLMWAARTADPQLVQRLLAAGADPQDVPDTLERRITELRAPFAQVRIPAAQALGSDWLAQPAAVEALITTLADSNDDVRYEGAIALARLPATAPGVAEAMVDALQDPDERIRWLTTGWLLRSGGVSYRIGEAIITALQHPDEDERFAATARLITAGVQAPAIMQVFINVLQDSHEPTRCHAAWALREYRHEPHVARALIAALSDADPGTVQAAIWSLGEIGVATTEVLAALRNKRWNVSDSRDVMVALTACSLRRLSDPVREVPRQGRVAVLEAIWRPGWYGYRGIKLDDERELHREVNDDLPDIERWSSLVITTWPASLPSRVMVRVVSIYHPELGHVAEIVADRLGYRVVTGYSERFVINAEEFPGLIGRDLDHSWLLKDVLCFLPETARPSGMLPVIPVITDWKFQVLLEVRDAPESG